MSRIADFRVRLREGAPLIGTFIKTPSLIVAEVLARAPLDCICLDTEHAPFDRLSLDACVAALRAADMPSIVRVQTGAAHELLTALDCGATGVLVPHVCSARQAREIAQAAHYGPGGRGFSGGTRAAEYGHRPMHEHLRESAASTVVIAQIEDADAMEAIDDIAAIDGIDALFVGRMDLTLSLGAASPADPRVLEAVIRVCDAGRDYDRTIGMYVPASESLTVWRERGASLFLLASDLEFLMEGGRTLAERLRRS